MAEVTSSSPPQDKESSSHHCVFGIFCVYVNEFGRLTAWVSISDCRINLVPGYCDGLKGLED